MSFTSGQTEYHLARAGGQVIYQVQRGSERLTLPIQWAFGVGNTGQTYVYLKDGVLYEARVSFYRSLNDLNITNGHKDLPDSTITEAAGRPLSEDETTRCFGCHMSPAGTEYVPGVQCTSCHAESELHAASFAPGGKPQKLAHLHALSSLDMANLCGRCHRTYDDVKSSGTKGVNNVRFQPYRLMSSRCFIANDDRISCVACHNPHEEVRKTVAFYDAKCRTCHAGTAVSVKKVATFKQCPVAKQNCTGCHMPKVELPEMHDSFTDHRIRVVRANAVYPD